MSVTPILNDSSHVLALYTISSANHHQDSHSKNRSSRLFPAPNIKKSSASLHHGNILLLQSSRHRRRNHRPSDHRRRISSIGYWSRCTWEI